MKRNVKIFCAALALVLVFGAVVGGTIAWLMDSTESITNTFTVGKVDIELTESDYDNDGDISDNAFKMVPGATITKDPKVKVVEGSEACWLFVKAEESANLGTYISYEMADDWTEVVGYDGVYYYTGSEAHGNEISVLADDEVTVNGTVTSAQMTAAESSQPTLTFTAYAVQSANLEQTTAAAVWAEYFATVNP